MMTMRIEMPVPDDMDPSDLLEHMQEVAVALAEEFADEDEEPNFEDIKNEVSVQEVAS